MPRLAARLRQPAATMTTSRGAPWRRLRLRLCMVRYIPGCAALDESTTAPGNASASPTMLAIMADALDISSSGNTGGLRSLQTQRPGNQTCPSVPAHTSPSAIRVTWRRFLHPGHVFHWSAKKRRRNSTSSGGRLIHCTESHPLPPTVVVIHNVIRVIPLEFLFPIFSL